VDVKLVASRLRQEYPADYPESRGLSAIMDGLQNQLTQKVRPMLLVLLATAGLVLLIACANVANLALARIMRREQEMAVRAALGANRGRLVRQLLTESTLLSVTGGALGLLLASGCLELLVRFVGRFTTRAAEVHISTEVLLFTLGVSILTGLIFGSIPALSQRLNLVTSLKEGSANATVKAGGVRLRNLLVAGQVALSFVLLIAAGLTVRSFVKLQQVNAGYNPENVLTANVPLNFSKYNNQATLAFFDRVMRKLEGTPGILAVGVNNGAPLAPAMPMSTTFVVEGRTMNEREALPSTDVQFVSPGSMQLLGIPLISGRFFTPHDNADSPEVAIVSRSLAQHFFPNEDPLNKRISPDNGKTWVKIVGVVGDVKFYGLDQETKDTAYVSFAQTPMGGTLLLKTAGNPMNYAQQVREAVLSVDPEQPVNGIQTLEELRGDTLVQSRLTALLLALFAGLALAIAATGLSGVTALMVSQRTREIGIRMALGAQSNEMLRMVLLQGMSVIGVGLGAGIVTALIFSRVMKTLLFQTTVNDPLTFVGVAAMFLAVGLAASYLPARRATQVDPLIALRSE
jgi:predicted permease